MTQRPAKNKAQVIIIGGGASGLAAACVLARAQVPFLLLEKEHKLGRKLLATGNGRCNLMNAGQPVYFGQDAFAQELLRHCDQQAVRAFFEGLGLLIRKEADGLCYPACNQASAVLQVLLSPLEGHPNFELLCEARVTTVQRSAAGFEATLEDGRRVQAQRLILAAGSVAQPQLSGSDSGRMLAQRLGHQTSAFRPALTAMITGEKAVRGLKGLRLPAICTLMDGQRPVSQAEGEVLFTQDGLSGVCIMQLSRDAGDILERGGRPSLYLDLSPMLNLAPRRYCRSAPEAPGKRLPAVEALLKARSQLPDPLAGALPMLLQKRLKGLALAALARALAAWQLVIQGIRGFEHAQVAAGGVDCSQIDPASLESRLVPGLHLTGELLDVDGDCGGHNLLFAWASGMLAGQAAARALTGAEKP